MINKKELVDALAKEMGCLKCESEKFLDAFKTVMQDYLTAGETVRLVGLFKAEVKNRKGRTINIPKTKVPIEIPDHKIVKFTASEILNKTVNDSR